MNKTPKVSTYIVFFLLIVSSISFAADRTLNLVCGENFPPFSYEENGIIKGMDVETVLEMAARLNIEVKIELKPWKRVLSMTELGKCDGAFSCFRTAERQKFAVYTAPVNYSTYSIFVKKGEEFKFSSITDLYGKLFGKNRGLVVSDEFDQAVKEGNISLVEISSNLVDLAMLNRFDMFVDNLLLTQYQLKRKKLTGQITPLPRPITKARGAYLIISKAAAIKEKESLVKKMTKVLREIHSDGTIQKIQNKYLK